MNKDEILTKMQDVFRDIFDDNNLVITPETTTKDIDGWDSLEQINLISSFEELFEIRFDMNEVLSFENVGDIIDAIGRRIA